MDLSDFPGFFLSRFPDLDGGHVLVALSGGPDSVALLHLLRDPSLGLELEAVHVHHQVRGAEADRDAEFCRHVCESLDIPFHLERVSPPAHPDEGRESAWRRLRYGALMRVAARIDADAVATAHQRDDVAEGVLVQLLRGAGPRALAGIEERTPEGVIRPLLAWSRGEILAWLADRKIPWRSDSSNFSEEHLRNVVRHRLLPILEEVSPAIRQHLVRLAGALAIDEAFLSAHVRGVGLWIDPWDPDGGVPQSRIAALHPALRVRWLHAQVKRAGLGRATRRQAEALGHLLDGRSPGAVTLAGRWVLRAVRGRLWLEPPVLPGRYSFTIAPGDEQALPLPGWLVRVRDDATPEPCSARWCHPVPWTGSVTVRGPEPDDTVVDGRGRHRLSRLLSARLPRHLRHAWPLVVAGATIVWVPGVWESDRQRAVGDVTVEVLRR